ncbi:dual specificity protein phosphatase family protein [Acinetobacter rongchengensis]|uniref:Protein tyrosine phosphatase n=1 Tax=Acinetobacter rongchengensis TaxID=2419601 RepID=A0A3A8F5M3_9GAMM|nr:dual specificity protein phosphatase family protein [Acinetobacter rongchengensis]RKG38400.1 protein tyrosine phosphatase [Acinetobacter rongchengensis]
MLKSRSLKYSVVLAISLQLTACMTTPTIAENERPQQWGKLVNKQHNFYQISQTVYRSEQPSVEAITELEKNRINIVVNLRSRDKDKFVLANQPFKLIHIPINTWAINRNDLLAIMQIIQTAERQNQKVLIHCYHGSDRTGASVAMYRIIFENWSIDDALKEMKHGGYGFHPIWVNIEKLFTPENIKWIREQLANPS